MEVFQFPSGTRVYFLALGKRAIISESAETRLSGTLQSLFEVSKAHLNFRPSDSKLKRLKLRELAITSYNQLIFHALHSVVEIYSFRFPPGFGERISLLFFHDTSHVGVRQRSPKLFLHTILVVYPRINFINKGLSIVQKLDVRYGSS